MLVVALLLPGNSPPPPLTIIAFWAELAVRGVEDKFPREPVQPSRQFSVPVGHRRVLREDLSVFDREFEVGDRFVDRNGLTLGVLKFVSDENGEQLPGFVLGSGCL